MWLITPWPLSFALRSYCGWLIIESHFSLKSEEYDRKNRSKSHGSSLAVPRDVNMLLSTQKKTKSIKHYACLPVLDGRTEGCRSFQTNAPTRMITDHFQQQPKPPVLGFRFALFAVFVDYASFSSRPGVHPTSCKPASSAILSSHKQPTSRTGGHDPQHHSRSSHGFGNGGKLGGCN